MAAILSVTQLKRLNEHKYSANGVSILEPFMQKFWRWLVEQIPMTWAPNAITLTGLIINIVTTLILVYYSPQGITAAPRWACILAGLGLFAYQALDAIDGKQARRTNSSTPLGELFDHGCDSVSTVFVIMGTCLALQLGSMPQLMFFECFATMFMFYCAHWQTYVSGTLKFGRVDVTEAQMCVISIYLLSGAFGGDVWSVEIPLIPGVPLKFLPIGFSLISAISAAREYFTVIFLQGGVGRNGTTVAGTSVLSPLAPIAIVVLLATAIWWKSEIFSQHPVLFIISFGMVASKVTNQLVIAHMTKSEMVMWDSSYYGPLLLVFNQYFNNPVPEYPLLWCCFAYCTFDLLRYSYTVCVEICNYLNIYCFKILPPDQQTNGQAGHQGNEEASGSARSRPRTRSQTRLSKS